MSRIAGVLRRTFGLVREHVGTDHLGNKYYSVPEQKTWTGKLSLVEPRLASVFTSFIPAGEDNGDGSKGRD